MFCGLGNCGKDSPHRMLIKTMGEDNGRVKKFSHFHFSTFTCKECQSSQCGKVFSLSLLHFHLQRMPRWKWKSRSGDTTFTWDFLFHRITLQLEMKDILLALPELQWYFWSDNKKDFCLHLHIKVLSCFFKALELFLKEVSSGLF